MLSMMVDLEEEEDWALADELEDDDFDRSVQVHDLFWLKFELLLAVMVCDCYGFIQRCRFNICLHVQ